MSDSSIAKSGATTTASDVAWAPYYVRDRARSTSTPTGPVGDPRRYLQRPALESQV